MYIYLEYLTALKVNIELTTDRFIQFWLGLPLLYRCGLYPV